jgi:rubredoxin
VDYALGRRALLAGVSCGRVEVGEVCDASSYLRRAARFHGVPTETTCPLCRKEPLTHVYWVFGEVLGTIANSARTPPELEDLAARFAEFTVHQVEVCRTCSWNYLIASFLMGHGGSARRGGPGRGRRASGAAH